MIADERDDLIPILDPYPVPFIVTFSIEKQSGQPLGITIKNTDQNTVTVTGISSDSFVKGTPIQVGTEILAINGEPAHDYRQTCQIIRSSVFLELTTFDVTASMSPFCYVEAAPTSKINPGITFDSCCDRTMVMVGDIFLSDRSRTRLRVGDIVLAVNGVPVWKPEEADTEC
jgi:S1-C subfamily serine protease